MIHRLRINLAAFATSQIIAASQAPYQLISIDDLRFIQNAKWPGVFHGRDFIRPLITQLPLHGKPRFSIPRHQEIDLPLFLISKIVKCEIPLARIRPGIAKLQQVTSNQILKSRAGRALWISSKTTNGTLFPAVGTTDLGVFAQRQKPSYGDERPGLRQTRSSSGFSL